MGINDHGSACAQPMHPTLPQAFGQSPVGGSPTVHALARALRNSWGGRGGHTGMSWDECLCANVLIRGLLQNMQLQLLPCPAELFMTWKYCYNYITAKGAEKVTGLIKNKLRRAPVHSSEMGR